MTTESEVISMKETRAPEPDKLLRSPKGSRKVTLWRINTTRLPDAVYSDAIAKIGSEWLAGTKSIIRGLNPDEEEKYLPRIIGIKPENPNWDRLVEEYWADFTIRVPIDGYEMEIWTDDWGRPSEANLKDYISWRFCQVSSKVATTEEELSNMGMYPFYVEDQAEVTRKAHEELEVEKEASFEFLKLFKKDKSGKQDTTRINWLLEMYKKTDRNLGNYKAMDSKEQELYIKKKSQEDPELFINMATDPDLETKAFIAECVSAGVLGKAGNAYLNGEEKIGSDLQEAIFYLRDKANSAVLITLKERLKAMSPVRIGQ